MKIVMVSDWESRGGAGTAANRLAHAFLNQGCEVFRCLRFPDQDSPPWERFVLAPDTPDVDWQDIPNISAREQSCSMLADYLGRTNPDAVNIHNLHGGIRSGWSLRLAEVCARFAPTVVTMHDMWSFTGRCAYNDQCQAFLEGCDDQCPTPNEYPPCPPRAISSEFALKRQVVEDTPNLAAATPSLWMKGQADKGFWGQQFVQHIPNGVPLDVFHPLERNAARRELGLDPSAQTLLLASAGLSDPRKGVDIFLSALSMTNTRPLNVIFMGRGEPLPSPPGVAFIQLGFVESEAAMARAYNAADIYVHPARMDNLPNTVAEAQACGTPCLALPAGGVPEMIQPGTSGWLAADMTPRSLAKSIDDALAEAAENDALRTETRSWAERKYSPERQVRSYLSLFTKLDECRRNEERKKP